MSKYTTEVRYICEMAANVDESKGFADVDEIIDEAIPKIFSFSFPLFDENYRNVICAKILRHYYTREIGFETVGLWKLKLQTKLNEIMPYYNQLYNSELIKFNPLYDVDLNTTHVGDKNSENVKDENRNGTQINSNERSESGSGSRINDVVEGENRSGTGNTDESGTGVSSNKNDRHDASTETGSNRGDKVNGKNYADTENDTHYDLYSDTPQGALDGVEDEEYLTNARKVTDAKNKNGKSDETQIEKSDYTKGVSGDVSENGESTSATQTNTRNSFEENNERTSLNKETNESDRHSTDNGTRTDNENLHGTDKFNSTESYVLHVVGKQAGVSYSKLLKEFRETFLNIDMKVIDDLSDLFFNLW